jgi:hypothetical protein
MPRPEQVRPTAPEGAPHGSTAAIERVATAAPIASPQQPVAIEPVQPEQVGVEQPQFEPERTDGLDAMLFAPTMRPDEPITAGAPFGPGPNYRPTPLETPRDFLTRIGNELANSPVATPAVRRYADRIRRGE